MGLCRAEDCYFGGTVVATGSYAGGIVGGGYDGGMFGDTSAPNTPCVSIVNCSSDGSITGANCVGGLFGGRTRLQAVLGKRNWIYSRTTHLPVR